VAEAARACGREVVVVGRAMDRVIDVAAECGYLDDLPEFRPADMYGYLPRDRVVALLTGSQGEPRAALARIADDEHPAIALSSGDRVIFSSRAIPGNEKGIGAIINKLVGQGIEVVTDRTDLVHVSGHPRRDELEAMYRWTRPRIAVPAHGEDLHLSEHAAFARAQGVPEVVAARNGGVVRLAPAGRRSWTTFPPGASTRTATSLSRRATGRSPNASSSASRAGLRRHRHRRARRDRRRPGGGHDRPAVHDPQGRADAELIADAVGRTLDGLSRPKLRDPEAVENAVDRAVRSAVQNVWGRSPPAMCS
jgi:ribonuclease J